MKENANKIPEKLYKFTLLNRYTNDAIKIEREEYNVLRVSGGFYKIKSSINPFDIERLVFISDVDKRMEGETLYLTKDDINFAKEIFKATISFDIKSKLSAIHILENKIGKILNEIGEDDFQLMLGDPDPEDLIAFRVKISCANGPIGQSGRVFFGFCSIHPADRIKQ